MKNFVLITGAIYGMLSVILGALGAHALKKVVSPLKLQSFEVGVRYMMYHALALLILGVILNFNTALEKNIARSIIAGSFLFSVSIYLLTFSEKIDLPTKFIGPITPIGGGLMIVGWALLAYYFMKIKF